MVESNINILIVDDDLKIADLLKIHLLKLGNISCSTVSHPEAAITFLEEERFDIVVSDLRMPGMSGLQFLTYVNDVNSDIIKILFTGFGDLNALHEDMAGIGVSYFISKPWQKAQIDIVFAGVFKSIYLKRESLSLREELNLLRNDKEFLSQKVKKNLSGTVLALRELVELSSHTVTNHCRRTSILVTNLARRMGKSLEFIDRVQTAAFLHDLSLITYPSHIQQGLESYMSPVERNNYLKHPELSGNLLGNIDDFRNLADIVRYHHENIDGTGFYGVSGEDLPNEVKMIRICDCYDEEETYNRNAHQKTLDYMKMYRSKWFDEEIFDEFYLMINSFKK
jgi:adenylate cyclase